MSGVELLSQRQYVSMYKGVLVRFIPAHTQCGLAFMCMFYATLLWIRRS